MNKKYLKLETQRRYKICRLFFLILVLNLSICDIQKIRSNSLSIIGSNIQPSSKKKTFCPPGCLKCEDNICLMCDFFSGFSLIENSCRPPSDLNCLMHDETENCILCNNGYYFNSIDGLCLEIESYETIQNCQFYSGPLTCSICQEDYIINFEKCIKNGIKELNSNFDLIYYK